MVAIVTTTSGVVGTIVLVTATLKVNDWNLYSSSLGVTNALDTAFGLRVSRAKVTIALGVLGTALAAFGIADHLVGFLVLLGVAVPPIAGILIAEYYVVRRWRADLAESRARGELPASAPGWVPAALIAWPAAALIGHFVTWGIPALNALVAAFILYAVIGRLSAKPRTT